MRKTSVFGSIESDIANVVMETLFRIYDRDMQVHAVGSLRMKIRHQLGSMKLIILNKYSNPTATTAGLDGEENVSKIK